MAAVPEELELELQAPASDNNLRLQQPFVVDGSKAPTAVRTYDAPRSFELSTENFMRKTGMRDRGPPGFEYNNPKYLSISATKPGPGSPVFLAPSAGRNATLPGVHVRSYAATPTRNDRLEEAEAAAQARAEEARRIAAKSRRDRKIAAVNKEAGTGVPGTPWKSPQGLSTVVVFNVPRSRTIEDHAWREALRAKAQALAASPRAGKPDANTGSRGRRGGAPPQGQRCGRAAAVGRTKGAFQGVKVPADAFERPFAGGTVLDALPGRLESLIFPQRYLDWPKAETLPALAVDIQSSPVRHAVAFSSKQPRIVCHDPQRETRGWDGPGAFEWDEAADAATATATSPAQNGDEMYDGSNKGHAPFGSRTKGFQRRGICVRDPERESRVFREGSTGFISPCQTNVRGFAAVPVSGSREGGAAGEDAGVAWRQAGLVSGGDGRGSPIKKPGRGPNGGRKIPQKLWMFQTAEKEYHPTDATESWGGPGAYDINSGVRVRVKEPGRVSPVFREGASRRGPSRWERDVSAFPACPGGRTGTSASSPSGDEGRKSPATPDILTNWTFSSPEFSPPEPRTMAHDVKTSPVRFGSCFLSVTERFDPAGPYATTAVQTLEWAGSEPAGGGGRGERGQGGFGEPVERYDLINARKQPSTSNTWLGTSIRPGLPYNPSLATDTAAPTSTNTAAATATAASAATDPFSTSCLSQPSPPSHPVTDASETSIVDTDTIDSGESMAVVVATDGGAASAFTQMSLPAVGGKAAGVPSRVPAVEAAATAAAATAAAGLARNWAGSRRDTSSEGVEGGGERVRRELNRARVSPVNSRLGGIDFVREGGGGAAGGAAGTALVPLPPTGGPERASNSSVVANMGPKGGEETGGMTVGAGECPRRDVALSSALATVAETIPAAVKSPAGAATVGTRIVASLPQARSHSRKLSASRSNSNSAAVKRSSGQADGGAKGKRFSATPITEESLAAAAAAAAAAATASMTAAEAVQEAAMATSSGLIRTIGRAKRGPCMLTLSSSSLSPPHNRTKRRAKKRGAGSDDKGHGDNSSSMMKRVWEAEKNGGLLGPGKTKVLVC